MLRSLSLLVLVVVLVIVLLLVARSWNSVAPTAFDIHDRSTPTVIDDRGETEAGESVRSGTLPGLGEMQEETDQHARQVQEALAATN